MEISYEEAEKMIGDRLREYPKFEKIISDSSFEKKLNAILVFEKVDPELLSTIKTEILIVLALYSPLSKLAENISSSTGLAAELAENVVLLIESTIIDSVLEELVTFESIWQNEISKQSVSEEQTHPIETEKAPAVPVAILTPVPPVVVPTPSPIPEPPKAIVIPHTFEPAPEYKERLELRPQGVPIGGTPPQGTTEEKRDTSSESNAIKPLTREELMNALATKRTMASDIEAIRMKREGVKEGSTPSVNTPPTPPSPVVK